MEREYEQFREIFLALKRLVKVQVHFVRNYFPLYARMDEWPFFFLPPFPSPFLPTFLHILLPSPGGRGGGEGLGFIGRRRGGGKTSFLLPSSFSHFDAARLKMQWEKAEEQFKERRKRGEEYTFPI